MNKRKETHGFQICGLVLIMVSMLAICLSGCGKEEEAQQPADIKEEATVEETVEESVEVQEPVEEETVVVEESTEETIVEGEQEEDPTANLSNEEWVISLNVERPTFLVFNEITGERKVLKDGAEYTLVEGDELGLTMPSRWLWQGDNIRIYDTKDFKYHCVVYTLNYDMISEKTEFTTTYNNRDGEPITATVYLSK